jgi:tungstate transport system substrate-binding protein
VLGFPFTDERRGEVGVGRGLLPFFVVAAAALAVAAMAYQHYSYRARQTMIMATTTSLYDSGLLDYLNQRFSEISNVDVQVLAKGSGESIEIARRGDVDLVLIHSRTLEEEFTASGHGVHRVGVMYNDFIIVGPRTDSAGISGLRDAKQAFLRIRENGRLRRSFYVSRADGSGTHLKELEIWRSLGLDPSSFAQPWYVEAGSGMGVTLRLANEKQAYALTDRGTWLSFKDQLSNLALLVEGDQALLNPYAAIPVNPEKHSHRNFGAAVSFVKFLISDEAQSLIGDFKKGNERLFWPLARDFQMAARLGFPNQPIEVAWYDLQPSQPRRAAASTAATPQPLNMQPHSRKISQT